MKKNESTTLITLRIALYSYHLCLAIRCNLAGIPLHGRALTFLLLNRHTFLRRQSISEQTAAAGYHGIIKFGRNLQDHQVQPLDEHNLVNQTAALNSIFSYFLNFSRSWDFSPGKFSLEILPDVQHEYALAQFEIMPSCSLTIFLGEEAHPHMATLSFQAVLESDKVTHEPPFLQAKQPQFPQLFVS